MLRMAPLTAQQRVVTQLAAWGWAKKPVTFTVMTSHQDSFQLSCNFQ